MSIEAVEAVINLIECGFVNGNADIVKCLRSALKEPQQGYAGITIWGGDVTVTKIFTEPEIAGSRDPSLLIKQVVQQCLDELGSLGTEEQS